MIYRCVLILLLAYLLFGLVHQNKGKAYGYKLDLFIDLFFGAAVWCQPGITISAETGLALQRAKPPLWAKALGWFLDHIQANHCALAIQDDIARAQLAILYLQTKQE